jgi:hypothetical protein
MLVLGLADQLLHANKITLKDVAIRASEHALSDVDRLNGIEWAYAVTITAAGHRYASALGEASGEWQEGAGPLSSMAIFVHSQNGKIWWSATPTFFGQPGLPAYCMDDETFFFDLLFHNYLPPGKSIAEAHHEIAIAEVLEQDATASYWDQTASPAIEQLVGSIFASGRTGPNRPNNSGVSLAVKMKRIDLQACPTEFQRAYEEHIDAWKRQDEEAIKETWQNVRQIAQRYGVG